MSWHLGMLCAFDLETTGVSVDDDRIVTACVALIDGSGQTAPGVLQWIADPGIDIPEGASDIHGVTTERAQAEGRPAAEVIWEVRTALADALAAGIPIVGHNVSYDLTLLDREARRYALTPLDDPAPVVDTMVLDKAVDRFRKGSRTLTATCEHYGVRIDGAHDASFDAVASARIAWRIAQRNPQIAAMTLAGLHEMQQIAKKGQDDSFADYLRKQARAAKTAEEQVALYDRADAMAGHWPLIPYRPAGAMA